MAEPPDHHIEEAARRAHELLLPGLFPGRVAVLPLGSPAITARGLPRQPTTSL